MLTKLSIKNYAIIESLEIEFSSGLNIITGETGAGKSIIMGALGLILGQRADNSVLLNSENKSVIEGIFCSEPFNSEVINLLRENDLDFQDELVIRREINSHGKSRAFVNDSPVTLSALNRISSFLVDLHQQFDTHSLTESDFQREVVDAFAKNDMLLKTYKTVYQSERLLTTELNALIEQKDRFNKEFDYNQFLFNELEEASFKVNELEELENELRLLLNSEGIKTALGNAHQILAEDDKPVLGRIKNIISQLQPYTGWHADVSELMNRLNTSYIELKDIAGESLNISSHIGLDPSAADKMNERLAQGYRLFKKHSVKSTNELLIIQNDLAKKLKAVLDLDEIIETKEKESAAVQKEMMGLAARISESRNAEISQIEVRVNKMLSEVGMPNARIRISLNKVPFNQFGSDEVVFLFDANQSGQFQSLRKVASGGELSRLMLCIKSLVARSVNLPTLIFDEIDSGISGEAARQVGIIMKELADARQVMCITHQPQIASKAQAHYLVYKTAEKKNVKTGIRLLNREERIETIAKMLSGEKPTSAAIQNAREMVMN